MAIGVYIDTKGSAGISANANMAKAYGNGETTTHANSHINVAGTPIPKTTGFVGATVIPSASGSLFDNIAFYVVVAVTFKI